MFRLLTFCCLLVSLGAIAVMTLNYVDPPITDPLVFGFIKSNRYLPSGDSINRVELYSPVQKLLADDRRAYKSILSLSGVAVLSAFGLFFSSSSRRKGVELNAPPNSRPPSQLPTSPEAQSSDSQQTPSSSGCG